MCLKRGRPGIDSNFFGLWGGSNSTSAISNKFAASNVTVTASFRAYAEWPSVPGSWYDSSTLNMANTNSSSPPWPSAGDPGWNDFFGAQGSLLRVIASLMVVDGMDVVLTSDANFSDIDKQEITDNAMRGIWPWFTPTSGSTSITFSFDEANALVAHTITQLGTPIVIGANVLDIGRYLGHG